jgi:hypothetical protein
MAYSPHGSRIVYPSLPETLTEDDLRGVYRNLPKVAVSCG